MAHINAPKPLPAGWADRQRTLITKLLSEMAKVLGYDLQQLDVLEGGYYPQEGIADIELEQQAARRAVIEVFTGNRPLIISPAAPAPPMPFPPPPPPDALPGTKK